jgi:predicted nucleotidyltransferase component of viral defense system
MNLYYNTVSNLLLESLQKIMAHEAFNDFFLVGGTALSLQLGHRTSIDIDLFTSINYGSMNTEKMKNTLSSLFDYTENLDSMKNRNLGYSVHVGKNYKETVKIDMFYTNKFIRPIIEQDGLRLASLEDIAAMKMQAITLRKKKKDFWDVYELLKRFSFDDLLNWGIERNPYELTKENILKAFDNVENVDDLSDFNSLKGDYWDLIALDLKEIVNQIV